jgi:anti-sigma regulatory factor (Ser/Thr protein kinase)
MEKSIILANDIAEVSRLNGFIDEVGEAFSLSPDVIFNLNLVLEEAVTNVVMYAYPEGKCGSIEIVAKCDGSSVTFVISDSGKPFDPTMVPDVDVTLPAEERRIGGLGIFLIRQMMDSLEYRRHGGKNILVLNKKI